MLIAGEVEPTVPTADSPVREVWVRETGLPRLRHSSIAPGMYKHIVVGTDLTIRSRPAEKRAMDLAERTGARLLFVGAVSQARAKSSGTESCLRSLVTLARERGIDAAGRLKFRRPGAAIVGVADETAADLIVIAGSSWVEDVAAGSPCGEVILHSSCPVLIVHETVAGTGART